MVDAVEQTKDYPFYELEPLNLYIMTMFVFLGATAGSVGYFMGTFVADHKGYNFAFVISGITLIVYAAIYFVVCGLGPLEAQSSS